MTSGSCICQAGSSTTCVTPPDLFAFVIFQVGSPVFAWGQSQWEILLPAASCIVEITGTHYRLID
jgi:hypothetical protein